MYFEEEEDEPKRVERETKKMQSSSYLEPLPFGLLAKGVPLRRTFFFSSHELPPLFFKPPN